MIAEVTISSDICCPVLNVRMSVRFRVVSACGLLKRIFSPSICPSVFGLNYLIGMS